MKCLSCGKQGSKCIKGCKHKELTLTEIKRKLISDNFDPLPGSTPTIVDFSGLLHPIDRTGPMPDIEKLRSIGMCPECWGQGAILNSHKCSEYYKKSENLRPGVKIIEPIVESIQETVTIKEIEDRISDITDSITNLMTEVIILKEQFRKYNNDKKSSK